MSSSFIFCMLLILIYIKLLQANKKRDFEIYELFTEMKSNLILKELEKIRSVKKNVFEYEENKTETL